MQIKLLKSVVLALFVSACSFQQNKFDQEGYTVISNVQIINVRDGSVKANMDVAVRDGRFEGFVTTGSDYEKATVIEGKGNFLFPGLAEMHAHIPSPVSGGLDVDDVFFLYLANGVTTVRGMLGHPSHLELREKAKQNLILSPRIFTSSPSLNGTSVQTVEDAQNLVAQYKNDGYDFLKLHPGIRLHVFDEIIKTARAVDIPYAGHVSIYVGVRNAINSGYSTIDHVDGFIEGLVPESMQVDPTNNGFFGYNFAPLVDMSLLEDLVTSTRENKVWIVPTQSLFDRWFSPQPPEELASEPEMKYLPNSYVEQWVENKNRLIGHERYDAGKWENFNMSRKFIIRKLHENGQGLLLGSDAPQVFNVPGFSIYHELKGITAAGLSNLEAIQTGTLNVAKFFQMEGEIGEITEGASADFMLLSGNPIENLENLRAPEGIMVRGRWLDREFLDEGLERIAQKSAIN